MTLRLSDAERDLALKPEPQLSRIRPGHWRCLFRPLDPSLDWPRGKTRCGCEWGEGGECLECERHVSREIADEYGAAFARKVPLVKYLHAVFIPGEPA